MACVGVCNPSHCPLPSWCTVVQSNRLNSLSFTSPSFRVRFPRQEFDNDFAKAALIPKIVIPGGFLKALTTGIVLPIRIARPHFCMCMSMYVSNFCNHFMYIIILIEGNHCTLLYYYFCSLGGSDGGGTQTPVPPDSTTTLSTPSAVSPTTSQTPPTTPPTGTTTDTNNQAIAKPVDVVSFTMNNLQKLLPLRLTNEP